MGLGLTCLAILLDAVFIIYFFLNKVHIDIDEE